MIVLKNEALLYTIFSDDEAEAIKYFIKSSADHDCASTGQLLAYKFLKSLDGNDTINLNDIIYHFESYYIRDCIMARTKGHLINEFWEIID